MAPFVACGLGIPEKEHRMKSVSSESDKYYLFGANVLVFGEGSK